MSNGIVNGSIGIESKFGEMGALPAANVANGTHPASLGLKGEKSAYVPPHMRSAQRAASSPVVSSPAR